ncbi:MAG: leucine-rich repeat protein [Clostridia bacterium]|nr:leucine-rich repeat protein [Clostridia bacterium]
MKRSVSIFVAAVIAVLPFFTGLTGFVHSEAATEIDNKCGDNVTWNISSDGTLTISGAGELYDSVRPWKPFASQIKSVVVEEGITRLGTFSLFDCSSAKKIHLAASIEVLDSFSLPDNVEIITFGENSLLSDVYKGAYSGTKWFKNQPADKPVYLGRCLVQIPENQDFTSIEIKEGTYAISEYVFRNSTVTDIVFPDSLTAIGRNVFDGCAWLEAQPDGPVYAGNVFLTYKGVMPLEKIDFVLPEGTTGIAGTAFFENTMLCTIKIPESVRHIGEYAFVNAYNLYDIEFAEKSNLKSLAEGAFSGCSKLKEINLPDSLETIGKYAFSSSGLSHIHIPKNALIHIHHFARLSQIESYSVDEANPFYCTDEHGALYSKDMTILYSFPPSSVYTEYHVKPECKTIRESAFSRSTNLETINLNYGLKKIEINAFEFCKGNVYVSATVTNVNSYALSDFRGTVYCYENSAMHAVAEKWSKPYVLLDEAVDDTKITQLISSAENTDRTLYTVSSLEALDAALNAVDLEMTGLTQEKIIEWETAIEDALKNLEYKPADYSDTEKAIALAEKINRSLYTPESLERLDSAISAVDYELTVDRQATVEQWTDDIEKALDALEYKSADYSAVNEQIKKANGIDRKFHSEISLVALDTAVNAVEYGLDITQQEKVNSFAQAIADAIGNLGYASVVLRHDGCGVIVSATAKEINPYSILTAEKVDPSNYEGTNFAVGGSIRSLHFYDINLVLDNNKVQPDGTVTVKIKLANGVDPAKCKVYHVTEDIVNPLVRFASTIDGNYIVFETTHFSEFAVIEVETVLESIEITNPPAKTDYIAGESLDTSGMKVAAKFSDGTSREITDYTVGMVSLDKAGNCKVTIYYTFGSITKATEYEVNVAAKAVNADITENGKSVNAVNKKLGLFSLYSRAAIQLDCIAENAEDCTLRWSSDNKRVLVDENGRVTCKGLFGAKKANITLEVVDADGNVVATDSVRVIFYKLSFQLSNAVSVAINLVKKEF